MCDIKDPEGISIKSERRASGYFSTAAFRDRLKLYLCTDRALSLGRPIAEAVEAAIRGGVTMVQIREKDATTREFYEIALKIQAVAKRYGVPLMINDRLDIALAVGADGLHLGQSDMPVAVARRIVGQSMFIGATADTEEAALAAQREGADYIGTGAVFPTGSKADAGEAIGLGQLGKVCASVNIPVIGIGGVGPQNVASVIAAGAAGAAAISSILSQPDIESAARGMRLAMG